MPGFRQQIRFATTRDGLKIAFADSGKGHPLVRAAHWMTHLEWDWQTPVWGPWLESLSSRHHFYRYDSRGCGLSDRNIESVTLEDLVADLEAVVDAAYFVKIAAAKFSAAQLGQIQEKVLKAYRWQYIVSGAMEPRFQKVLFGLVDESQATRIRNALAPLTYAVPDQPEMQIPLAA